MRLFCFGLGYTAAALANKVRQAGGKVAGTYRTADKAEKLASQGLTAHLFDGAAPMQNAAEALAGITHLLISVPPGGEPDPVLRRHADDIRTHAKALRWIGYLSTIGVYGDCGGDWIDENTPPNPISDDSRQRLHAEAQWLDLGRRTGVPVHVFRLPGIYGPGGRSQLDALQAGRAHRIVKDGQVFNRIHVEDLAAVLLASMQAPKAGAIYNVADDEPAPAQDVVTFAAELLGVAPPPLVPIAKAGLPPFAASFYDECKRVKNGLIKRELGITLAYPTYREGLKAIASSADKACSG